jgi:cell division protein FtsI (penicillin-binding protein 3)
MAEPRDPNVWRPTIRTRVLVVAAVFGLWAVAIEARLFYLQVYAHQFFDAELKSQSERLIDLPARRGDIVDRNGRLLAYSVDAESIYAEPRLLASIPDTVDALCRALGDCSAQEAEAMRKRLEARRGFAWVRRAVSAEQASRVGALKIKGIGLRQAPRRYYPNRELAAHVLGYVGIDEQGLGGIEAAWDSKGLSGRPGKMLVQQDLHKRVFSSVGAPPAPGVSLELTLDSTLQYMVERELKAGVEQNHAAGGSAVIVDPNSGEIFAMANEPTFNPNEYGGSDAEDRKNRAVQYTYEPGSTFKMVTATAGLEEKVVTPETMIETGDGVLRLPSRVVSDTHAHGTIPFREVIALSSNIGAIKVGWMLRAERLAKYVGQFGFGTRLSRDLPGESAGLVWPPSEWTHDGALASVAMGYQIGVTPLQMAAAASAIANGGELVEPRVVRAKIEGNTRGVYQRRVIRRVMSPGTSATLTSILEEVVDRGTGTTTQIEGYTVAGKTGTASKLVNGHYSKSEYNASFVGFLPSRQPVMTIIVVIDTPRAGSKFGGVVAGPIFQRIASQALRYLGVPPTVNPARPLLVRREPSSEVRVAGPLTPLTILAPAPSQATGDLALPELRGMGGREALRVLARLGLAPRVSGDGVVLEQEPAAGTAIEPGASCRLVLGRSSRDARAGGLRP